MSKEKMQYCWYCGEELGIYRSYPGDIETCGKPECEREARHEEMHDDNYRPVDSWWKG